MFFSLSSSLLNFSFAQRWQDHAFRGVVYKVLSCLCFAGIYGCVRYFAIVSKEFSLTPLPAPELAFFETAFGLLFVLPWIFTRGLSVFKFNSSSLYMGRAVVVALGIILWFMALSKMSLVQVTAFKYAAPVFTFLGAKFYLKEKCGWERGISIGVAFVGALVVTGHEIFESRFDWSEVSILLILPLGATACHALAALFGKRQAKQDSPQTITLYLLLMTLPLLGGVSVFEWVTPEGWQWPWLILMGGLLASAYFFLSQAYVTSDLTYLIPASFTRLAGAAFMGILFFNEWPTSWVWVGLFLIAGATINLCKFESSQKNSQPKQRLQEREATL